MIKTEQILQQVNDLPVTGKSIVVGNSLVHLPSFVNTLTPQFIHSVYTNNELAYCVKFPDSTLRYASLWAAKEAVHMAVRQMHKNKKLWWCDIEILRGRAQPKPVVSIKKLKVPLELSLTITDDGDYVWALVMCLYDKGAV